MLNTYVTIGVNENPDYAFLTPFTALLWRERIGFEPIVLAVGDWSLPKFGNIINRKGAVTMRALLRHGITTMPVAPMEGLETGRTAQQCRELVGCIDALQDEAWAMPADADLWPIRRAFYQQHQDKPGRVTSYYANGDHYQTLPTCHVTMQLSKWRALYGVKPGDDITAACRRNLEEWLPVRKYWHNDMPFTMWMADQGIVAHKVLNLPEGFEKIERHGHPPVDRLDRNGWPPSYDHETYVDAHMPRRPDEPDVWPRVLELFSKLLPQYTEWAKEYRQEYFEVMACGA